MEDTAKSIGPEFPADLEWSQGGKNPRKPIIEDYGTQRGDLGMDIDGGIQNSDTRILNESTSRNSEGTQICDTDLGNDALRHQSGCGGGPQRMPPSSQVTVAQFGFYLLKEMMMKILIKSILF